MLELLRDGILQRRGWKCQHEQKDRKFSRKAKQWYCTNCWTFFDNISTTRGKFEQKERLPIWEVKKEMSVEDWAKMQKPQNDDLK